MRNFVSLEYWKNPFFNSIYNFVKMILIYLPIFCSFCLDICSSCSYLSKLCDSMLASCVVSVELEDNWEFLAISWLSTNLMAFCTVSGTFRTVAVLVEDSAVSSSSLGSWGSAGGKFEAGFSSFVLMEKLTGALREKIIQKC